MTHPEKCQYIFSTRKQLILLSLFTRRSTRSTDASFPSTLHDSLHGFYSDITPRPSPQPIVGERPSKPRKQSGVPSSMSLKNPFFFLLLFRFLFFFLFCLFLLQICLGTLRFPRGDSPEREGGEKAKESISSASFVLYCIINQSITIRYTRVAPATSLGNI